MRPSSDNLFRDTETVAFPFYFAPSYRRFAMAFGVGPRSAQVNVVESEFDVRFGPWRVTTPLANIAGSTVTGPYRWYRTAGPAHYSLADHGLTFATNGDSGLCIAFHEAVTGIEPMGVLHHPSLTVTVADVTGLERALEWLRPAVAD